MESAAASVQQGGQLNQARHPSAWVMTLDISLTLRASPQHCLYLWQPQPHLQEGFSGLQSGPLKGMGQVVPLEWTDTR